jgi:tryptophanyl-tRNA synthetase
VPNDRNWITIIENPFVDLAPQDEQEVPVPEDDKKHKRTSREIVEDVSKEPDPKRVAELSHKLIKALDEETKKKLEHLQKPEQKAGKKSA